MNYQPNTLNPNFFKAFELEGELPSDWKLVINIKSYSPGLMHSLIGSTTIDLENRYLCDFKNRETIKYRALEQRYNDLLLKQTENEDDDKEDKETEFEKKKYKGMINKIDVILTNELKAPKLPVESRPLINPDKKVSQGMIEMFVEVLTKAEATSKKIEKIEPPPPQEFELRLIIWETKEIPAMDPVYYLFIFHRKIPKPSLSNLLLIQKVGLLRYISTFKIKDYFQRN